MAIKSKDEPGRFNIVLTIGIISGGAAAVLIFAYIQWPEHRDILTFAMGAIATASGVTTAYYVGASLRETARSGSTSLAETARSSKLTRTLQYPQRWGDPAFVPTRKAVREVTERHQDHARRREKIMDEVMANPDLERSVIATMSFLEEMALAINIGAVDEDILDRYFRTIVLMTFEPLGRWIEDVAQAKRGKRLYQELEILYDSWSAK